MVSIIEHWREISAAIGGIVLFFSGRKSVKIQERKNNAEAVSSMQQTYDVFLKHYKEQYENIMKRLNDLEIKNSTLLKSEENWKQKFNELQNKYDKLSKDFEEYKRKHK